MMSCCLAGVSDACSRAQGQLNHKPFVLAVVYFWLCAAIVVAMHAWRFSLASPLVVFDMASLVRLSF